MDKQLPGGSGVKCHKRTAKNTCKDNKNQNGCKSSSLEIYTKDLETLISNFTELAEQNTKDESNINALRKECDTLQEKKCQLLKKNKKYIMERNHIESFCRVLHDQNKRAIGGITKTTSETEEPEKKVSATIPSNTLKEELKQSTPVCLKASASEIINIIHCSYEDKDDTEQHKYQTLKVFFAFDSHKDKLNQMDKQMNEERQFTKAKLSQMQSEHVLWKYECASLIEALHNNETNINELKSQIGELNKKIETFENFTGDCNQVTSTTNENFLNSVKERKASTRKLWCLFKEAFLLNNNIQNTLKTLNDLLDAEIYETKLKKSIERIKTLKTHCCQLLNERNVLLKILKVNNIPTKPKILIIKKEIPPEQRKMLVKQINCQLEAILKCCTISRDKMELKALLNVLKNVKLQNAVNCAVHLCLGYINVKFSYTKRCEFQQNLLKQHRSSDCSCYDNEESDSFESSS